MTDELAPALTAKEWALSASVDNLREIAKAGPDNVVAGIALANAALPPDSPYKITREDVRWIEAAARRLAELATVDPVQATGVLPLAEIAAKLAALLPPDA